MPTTRTRRTKTRAQLTPERIFAAAIKLADSKGVGSLSMRKLAVQLGVEAMSLYHHVANKDEILDGIVDAVFSEVARPEPGEPWKPAMRRRACSFRDALTRHPWAITLMESRRNPGPATIGHHDAVIGCLRNAGFSIGMAAHAYAILDSFIYGFAVQKISLPFENSEGLEEVAGDILAQLPADMFPHLTEMAAKHVMQPGYSFDNEFDFGLELILDGLERAQAEDPGA